MKKNGKKLIKKVFALLLAVVMAVPVVDYGALLTVRAEETGNTGITLRDRDDGKAAAAGYEEGAYVEWLPVAGANGYEAYVSQDQSNWTPIDDELIRSYEGYWRADALGLTKGTWYVKVEAAVFDTDKNKTTTVAEKVETVTVTAHDRSGYAWIEDEDGVNTASGAYNDTGTLRSNANVIYVYNSNKDNVELEVNGTTYIGLQNILNAYNTDNVPPLDVRIIGNIDDFAKLDGGDILIDTNKKNIGITIEGVGEDAVANGWGIRLKNAVNVEIRNLGFMNCDSDEGDNIGLQQNNTHIWVHNCDLFYGKAGSDADQKKGDGMLDCKWSDLITFSYNHFWDSGKSCLLGLSEGYGKGGRITYHHNWFDHSDSRHPRARYFDAHVYNNYYDGNAKYGIGATQGASVFAESNYFRNTKNPMLISQQGTDVAGGSSGTFGSASSKDGDEVKEYEDGGMIKAYGNILVGLSESTFIPYAEPVSSTQEDSSQSKDNGFVAYVAIDDTDEETDLNNGLNNDVSVDEDVNVDDDDIKADTENVSDDNINDDADNVSDDNSADVDMNELSGDNSADMDEVSGDDNANVESGFEAEVSDAQDSTVTGGSSVDFDAYVVTDKTKPVPEEIKSKKGGNTYSNFDTETGFYNYTPDNADDVPNNVTDKAGRVNGGDLQFEFNDANDDTSSDINTGLQALCVNYESKLVSVGGINSVSTTVYYTVTFDPGNDEQSWTEKVEINTKVTEPATPTTVPEGKKFDGWYNGARKWNFDTLITGNVTLIGKWIGENESSSGSDKRLPISELTKHDATVNGTDSAYFDIEATTATSSSTSGTYNSVSYSSGSGKIRLDLRQSATIEFTTTIAARVVLFMDNVYPPTASTYIDGKAYAKVNGIIESDVLAPGDHQITRKDSDFMYAIWVEPIVGTQYIITVNNGDDSNPRSIELKIDAGESITSTLLPVPARSGYMFNGWKAENGETITLPYIPSDDMALTATWINPDELQDMAWLASDIASGTYKSNVEKNGFTVTATDAKAVTVENKGTTVDNVPYTVGLKTGGSGAATYRSIKFTTNAAADLYIVASSSNNTDDRIMLIAALDEQGKLVEGDYIVDGAENPETYDGGIAVKAGQAHSYALKLSKAGTYCIYSKDSAMYFYAVKVTYDNAQEPEPFTVTFDSQGGSTVVPQTVNSWGTCIAPTAPTRAGYVFGGWYTDSECTDDKEYNFDIPVTTDITLYAKWTEGSPENPTSHTVTFNTNGGSEVESQNIAHGQKCPEPDPAPTKEGNIFDGWYKDEELTEAYDFETLVTTDITLYAKWKDNNTENNDKPGLNIEFAKKDEEYTYTGSAIKPEIIVTNVTDNGKTVLVEGVDYTVKYANNINASEGVTALNKQPKITVTGKGIYAGKAEPKTFTINKKNLRDADIKTGKIFVIDNSKASTPVLYYGGMKLTTKNFEIKNRTQIFKLSDVDSKISIQGINNFKGDLDIDVEVVKDRKALKNAAKKFTVELNTDELKKITYTGNSLENKIKSCIKTVSDKTDKNVKLDSTKYAIAFSGNVTYAGTVKFTIVGLGEYSGCNVVKSCKIQPRTINEAVKDEASAGGNKVLIEGMESSLPYISTGAVFGDKLELTWITEGDDGKNVKLKLIEGRDYKLSYSGNKKGDSTARLNISFMGNYKGKAAPLTFTIDKAELSADTVKDTDIIIADKVCNAKNGVGINGVYKSTPYISMNGVMVKASEYEFEYYTKETMDPADKMTKQNPLKFENGQPYATVYVKITPKDGSNNYKKAEDKTKTEIKTSYKVWVKAANKVDLSRATVLFYKNKNDSKNTTKLEYTGNAVEPGKIDVKVGRDQVNNSKYGYKIINNVNKGKATVLIYANDGTDAIGARVVTYNITSHNVGGFKW